MFISPYIWSISKYMSPVFDSTLPLPLIPFKSISPIDAFISYSLVFIFLPSIFPVSDLEVNLSQLISSFIDISPTC